MRVLPPFARREVLAPAPTTESPAALNRLQTELRFYDASATNKRRLYQTIRLLELVLGASVPAAPALALRHPCLAFWAPA